GRLGGAAQLVPGAAPAVVDVARPAVAEDLCFHERFVSPAESQQKTARTPGAAGPGGAPATPPQSRGGRPVSAAQGTRRPGPGWVCLVVAVAVGRLVPRVIRVVLARVVVAGVPGGSGGDPLLQLLDGEAFGLLVLPRFHDRTSSRGMGVKQARRASRTP